MSQVGAAVAGWLLHCGLATVAVGALGWLPTARLAGPAGTAALLAGCATALAGAALGAAPVLWALARGDAAAGRAPAVAGRSMALRAGGTLALALAIALGSGVERTPYVVWVGLAYAALLVAETRWTVRWLAVLGK